MNNHIEKLPLEYPIGKMLKLYLKRFLVFFIVATISLISLGGLLLIFIRFGSAALFIAMWTVGVAVVAGYLLRRMQKSYLRRIGEEADRFAEEREKLQDFLAHQIKEIKRANNSTHLNDKE